MSSDSGIRKRNKDKKKKKGSAGDASVSIGASLREPPSSKLVIDETIHVQKDVSFGGNWCTKLIFIGFLVVLTGLIVFALSEISFGRVDESDEEQSISWYTNLFNFDLFAINDTPKQVVEEEPATDLQPQISYLEILWQFIPFGGQGEPPPQDAEESKVSKELENENDSPEDDSKESKEEENDQDEEHDKEKDNSDDIDDEGNEDNDDDDTEDNNLDSAEDSEDRPQQYNPNRYRYNSDNNDSKEDSKEESEESQDDNENNSPDESEEELEQEAEHPDNRYNYYHRRNEATEEKKYKFIRDDDLNDSAELGAREQPDSEENKDDNDDDTKKPDDDSHSSEEVEHEVTPPPEEPQQDEEPKADEENVQSGNMITKLSVGASLIFVAYSVIIRKWNNYVNRVADGADAVLQNAANQQNEENADIAQAIFENVMDLVNDDIDRFNDQREKNKTLQEYLETPSQSESEHSEDDSTDWQTQGGSVPLDLEESETASETEEETENSEAEQNTTSDYVEGYDRANVTNQYDWRHREELDDADDDLDRGRISIALEKYEKISKIEPLSVRAKYGIAKCLDKRAELQKSNQLLTKVIQTYMDALQMPDIPEALFKAIAERAINRMRFKGDNMNSISIQNKLVERFPGEVEYQNELVVSYLILNRISEAKKVLEYVLQKWPDNGLALVNYGFVLKMSGDLEGAVKFLYKGIESNDNGTQDSRFYFHLGDALQKLSRNDEAMQLYEAAAMKKIFLSKYQRSLYNVNRLTAKPWWTVEETKYGAFFKNLIKNWKKVRDEALKILKYEKNIVFREESEQLREIGDWRQFEIYSRGMQKQECKKVPVTCRIVSDFPPASGCRRGQVKFSLMEPGTHVWPHCGPTNCRLRAHLGLVVPDNVTIRVAEEVRSWKEGEILIFDDSFEHEVWHNGTAARLVLIVDVWHPELTAQERKSLTAI